MRAVLAKLARAIRASVTPFVTAPARRRGECRRCGTCCRLVFACRFVDHDGGCEIWRTRPPACRAFPRDRHDLAELPPGTCGYRFV